MDGFPIGIREHRVEQHVVVRASLDGHLQRIENDEVESDHVTRLMNLRKRHLLLDVLLQFPPLDSPFQRSSNRIGNHHFPGDPGRGIVFLFQPIEQGERT